MNNKNIFSGVFCIFFLFTGVVYGQQTGSFNRTVNFGGNPNWTLSYYVPSSYNAANKYKLIIALHGLGGTPQAMRDAVRTYVAGNTSSPLYNAIVVAPYAGGDVNTDFWSPVSDTGIITQCITDAMSAYTIDPDYIYLNGISLGGRAALRYGLINYTRFRGIELWCPAIQSVAEANNQTSFTYPYQNGKYIPVCITVGSEDGYVQNGQIPVAIEKLGELASLQVVMGMGHVVPPTSYIFSCYNNINNKASTNTANDAAVSAITAPFDEECVTTVTPTVIIQNKGSNNLTSATLNYQMDNGTVNTYAWSGNLISLGTHTVTLPVQSISVGAHVFNAYTSQPNASADAFPANDALTRSFNSLTNGSLSLSEGFENAAYPPFGWKQTGSNKVWSWEKISGLGAGGSASCIRFNNYTSNKEGKKYSIRTAQYDFSNATAPVLTYDYAYRQRINLGAKDDSLAIFYSTDCGMNWTMLLKKGGADLNTVGGTMTAHFVPTTSQWVKETINLGSLVGQPKVMFSFENRPYWGNLLYLDNINLTGITGISEETEEIYFSVYPNPTSGEFMVYGHEKIANSLDIYDVFGKIVFQTTVNSEAETISPNLPDGIYFLQLKTAEGIKTQKLVVSR